MSDAATRTLEQAPLEVLQRAELIERIRLYRALADLAEKFGKALTDGQVPR